MLSLRSQAARTQDAVADDGIAVVVLTHDRQPLLQRCVENVLQRASEQTREIVIWNNASTDSTREYLDSLDDPRIRAVHSERNVGQSGYARGFALTTSPFLVELDDDVTGAPAGWDLILRDAFKRLPSIGFLGADLEDDPNDQASHYRHHVRPHEYTEAVENGIRLFRGPTGGACAITSRDLYDRVGGFPQPKEVFWSEEAAYIAGIRRLGYGAAVLADLRVHHTGAPYYTAVSQAKLGFYVRRYARWRRRNTAKRALYALPLVERLNTEHRWFEPPAVGERLAEIVAEAEGYMAARAEGEHARSKAGPPTRSSGVAGLDGRRWRRDRADPAR
jgi:GT2 family glycosyltransferase